MSEHPSDTLAPADKPQKTLANSLDWRREKQHLPHFMRDFHDGKDLFRMVHHLTDVPHDPLDVMRKGMEISMPQAMCYTLDRFLWCMARFGYTLQKSRAKVKFESFDDALAAVNKLYRSRPLPLTVTPELESENHGDPATLTGKELDAAVGQALGIVNGFAYHRDGYRTLQLIDLFKVKIEHLDTGEVQATINMADGKVFTATGDSTVTAALRAIACTNGVYPRPVMGPEVEHPCPEL